MNPGSNEKEEWVADSLADSTSPGTGQEITEREHAGERLREYENVVEGLEEMIVAVDRDYRCLIANRSFLNYLQLEKEQAVGYLVSEILDHETFAEIFRQELAECFQGKTVKYELKLNHPGLGHRHLALCGFPIEDPRGENSVGAALILQDITESKREAEALRQSEERYRELFENAKDAIYVHDLSGRYTALNRAAEKLSGYSREEILGKHFSNFVAPRDLKYARTNLCKKLDEENETIYEVEMVTKQGRRVPVEVSSRLIYEKGVAVGVQGTARDISDRKRAQDVLQIYSQRLVEVQEAERENIAREFHDEIGQDLTAVRINLEALLSSHRDASWLGPVDESLVIINEALRRIDELSLELRPALLDDLGLASALRWYVDRYTQRTGIAAELLNGFEDNGRLSRELENACFKIAQEALTNIAHQAQANHVSVQLECGLEKLFLTITDNSVGFEAGVPTVQSSASSLVLRGMKEQALAVNGHIEIESTPKLGTRVRAIFPITRK